MICTPPRCILTGASSGIGLALARLLLDEGWTVIGVDRQPVPVDLGPAYTHHLCDLSDPNAVRRLALSLDGGPITGFVHAAGVMRTGGIIDTRDEDAALMWQLHVGAPMALLRAIVPSLLERRARIVLVSSRAVLGRAHRAAYASSKAAQIGLARSLAAELIGRGITVNVVAPGAVDTPMLSDPSRGAPAQISLPIGRLIQPDEVAGAVAYFLSVSAGAVTGQTLYVCGGASLGSGPL